MAEPFVGASIREFNRKLPTRLKEINAIKLKAVAPAWFWSDQPLPLQSQGREARAGRR